MEEKNKKNCLRRQQFPSSYAIIYISSDNHMVLVLKYLFTDTNKVNNLFFLECAFTVIYIHIFTSTSVYGGGGQTKNRPSHYPHREKSSKKAPTWRKKPPIKRKSSKSTPHKENKVAGAPNRGGVLGGFQPPHEFWMGG